MRTYFFLTGFLLYSVLLSAQFNGGPGDGVDAARAWQLDLEGIPSGVRPLYAGGSGDGYHARAAYTQLAGSAEAFALYTGGQGDGFARRTASAALAGTDLAQLYGGGEGDGYTGRSGNFTLAGITLTGLFSGGDGDGYARQQQASTPDGFAVAQLYGGGAGDGYAFVSGGELLGMPMTMLYGGGAGDGFDRRAGNFAMSGQDLAALYRGGGGDGADRTEFFGVIPLPLTLISFAAFPGEDYVLLRWVTEDEIATDFFTIEKTRTGHDFESVGQLPAAGFSSPGEQLEYEMKDLAPYDGTSYYRLKTTDFDGSISLSQLEAVHFQREQEWSFQLFPNPNTGQHFNLSLAGTEAADQYTLEISDAGGRIIYQTTVVGGSEIPIRFDLERRLTPGSYLIRLSHPRRGSRVKILLVGR